VTGKLPNNQQSHRQPVTLLVNSSDGFADCWAPYFKLLNIYWPQICWPILLNTETADYENTQFNVTATKVAQDEMRRLSWSECLIRAINRVKTPLLLYMQEDYFLHQPVDHDKVQCAVKLMLDRPDIAHIGLTKHGSHGPFDPSDHRDFGYIRRNARYRISTQAGLWRPEALSSYLRVPENGWMFEIYGTWRAKKDCKLFLTALVDKTPAPIDYVHTGIIKGQWHSAIPDQFARHNIPMDFECRGIYRQPQWLLRKWGVVSKLMQQPGYALAQFKGRL
jgi:hypothetical protein